jgi:Gram-negative bacterial TonB protein C-terminal
MRKLIVSVSLLFIFTTFVFAQNDEEVWQTYLPDNEEFSVEVPTSVDAIISISDKNKKIYSTRFQAYINGNYFFVFSANEEKNLESDIVKDFASDFMPVKTNTEIDKLTGKQMKFADDEGYFHQVVFIKSKHRAYIFHAVNRKENDSSVLRFFNSLKFFENKQDGIIVRQSDGELKQKTNTIDIIRPNLGIGRSGDNTQIPVPISKPLPTNPIPNPFKILKQPRANFTNIARKYNINGVVRLKATFLANGTIGSISVVNKLPFGLTNSAITAAKAIEFVPGATTVSKIVEYRFTLY